MYIGGGGPKTYRVYFPWVLKAVACPIDGCPSREKKTGRIRAHFMYLHWKPKVETLQEGLEPLPRCYHCGVHVPVAGLIKYRQEESRNKVT